MENRCESERLNVEFVGDGGRTTSFKADRRNDTLYGVLHRLIATILFPEHDSASASAPLLNRVKTSVSEHGPRLCEASSYTGRNVLVWTRKGSPLRAVIVISVGTITLLALTGLLLFTLFFLAATVNVIVIYLLMSLAAAGGFLALFFACVTAIYIGALSVAAFAISTATISAIIAAMVATGWIGFFYVVWLAAGKSIGLAKQSLSMIGSTLSVYSSARHGPEKKVMVAY